MKTNCNTIKSINNEINTILRVTSLLNIEPENFIRVNHDYYGKPRYVLHYLLISADYKEAVEICKSIGGSAYRGKEFGGMIVFQSYSLLDTIKAINMAVVNYQVTSYIINHIDSEYITELSGKPCKRLSSKLKVIASEFKRVCSYNIESRNYTYVKAMREYLQGLPSWINHEYMTYNIIKLMALFNIGIGLEEFKVDELYWELLATIMLDMIKTYL